MASALMRGAASLREQLHVFITTSLILWGSSRRCPSAPVFRSHSGVEGYAILLIPEPRHGGPPPHAVPLVTQHTPREGLGCARKGPLTVVVPTRPELTICSLKQGGNIYCGESVPRRFRDARCSRNISAYRISRRFNYNYNQFFKNEL